MYSPVEGQAYHKRKCLISAQRKAAYLERGLIGRDGREVVVPVDGNVSVRTAVDAQA